MKMIQTDKVNRGAGFRVALVITVALLGGAAFGQNTVQRQVDPTHVDVTNVGREVSAATNLENTLAADGARGPLSERDLKHTLRAGDRHRELGKTQEYRALAGAVVALRKAGKVANASAAFERILGEMRSPQEIEAFVAKDKSGRAFGLEERALAKLRQKTPHPVAAAEREPVEVRAMRSEQTRVEQERESEFQALPWEKKVERARNAIEREATVAAQYPDASPAQIERMARGAEALERDPDSGRRLAAAVGEEHAVRIAGTVTKETLAKCAADPKAAARFAVALETIEPLAGKKAKATGRQDPVAAKMNEEIKGRLKEAAEAIERDSAPPSSKEAQALRPTTTPEPERNIQKSR